MSSPSAPPLDGLLVLDFTRVIAGPYLTQMLGDLGAEIVKIEDPRGGDDFRHYRPAGWQGDAPYFLGLNRNKKSVLVDLASEAGRRACRELAAKADILVENFRPDVMAKYGLAYDDLKELNPRLVYCSISGYGHSSPFRLVAGYDPIAQAETGLMYLTGPEEIEPQKAGGSVADTFTSLHAGMGLMAALEARHRTGRGQHVDVSLFDSMFAATGYAAMYPLMLGEDMPRLGNGSLVLTPLGTYDCADGQIMIVVGNDRQYARFCEALERPDMADDPRYASIASRLEHRAALEAEVVAALKTRPRAEWVDRLRAAGVPAGAVRTPKEAVASPEATGRDMLQPARYAETTQDVVWSPLRLSDTPPRKPGRVPLHGEHTDEVLAEMLGYSATQIAAVKGG
ncbi:MAG: CoA transferase [Alphaproteobacteria bacterium]|nr:CoA transferase [Alphaproteobacteria bacterium]MCB9930186.1 CoA transferase [Alphaproteobacteria bacterium]